MAMVVKNNMSAISTLNTLNRNSASLTKSLQKVSSGMRINGAADDASGYAISERMRVQIRSLDQDNRNTQNGNSMMKVAEGAVSSTVEILKTLKEKVINAANDTNTDSDRATIQKELDQSIDQIDDNANVTYNGKYLVDGSKNKVGTATYTSLTNQSLSTDTTASTKLTDLKSRSGDELQLQSTDKITVSYVQQGKTYSTTFDVGDKTLQDIFTQAENIDKDSKTFATADNKSVAAAMGSQNTEAADAAAVKATISYLKEALGGSVTTASGSYLAFAKDMPATSNNIGDYSISAGTVFSTGTSGATGISTAKGELYKELEAAADTATMAYKTMAGSGTALKAALANNGNNPNFAWTVNGITGHEDWAAAAADLKQDAAQNVINGLGDDVKALYNRFLNDVDAFTAADKAAEDTMKSYNESLDQLSALEKEDTYNDKKSKYMEKVDAFVKELETWANDATTATVSYMNSDRQKVESAANDTNRASFVKTMVADIASQLKTVDVAGETPTDAAIPTTGKINAGMILHDIQVAGDQVNKTQATTGTNAAELLTAAKALVQQSSPTTGAAMDVKTAFDAISTQTVAANLKAAHEQKVVKFDGPQLLEGADIGLAASGGKVSTASGQNAITVTAANDGVNGQIAGFTIGITDKDGNTKKSAEASLDAFEETIRAQNKSEDNAISLQVGTKANQSIKVGLTDMRSQALGLKGSDGSTLNIGTRENANAAINVLDNALQKALDQQTTIGAVQSRLEYTSANLTTASENVTASESTIRDADMAKEMTEYTKNNVLLQAAQSMLSQANQNSSAVLSLLQ